MPTQPRNPDFKMILALTLVHFIGDAYSSFVNPLLPVFADKFALSLTQIGLIAGINRLLAFVVQPSVGYLADHYRTRFFILCGPLLAIVFIPLVGIAPSFLVLLLFISIGSIGSSMFHPTVAGMVSTYAGSRLGLSMSVFNTGGTLAFGVGPLFIAYFVSAYGLEAAPYTMIFGLAVLVYLYRIVPRPQGEGLKSFGFLGSLREAVGAVWRSIILIWFMMVLRAFVSQSFMTFVPVLYAQEGYALVSVGAIVSLFTVAGVLSGMMAGYLSDRFGEKKIFYSAYALATPCLYLLLYLPGRWVFVSAFLAGFSVMATLPLGVTLAQKIAPRGRSMVSSLMMGLAMGTGGMLTPLAGRLADLYSIRSVLMVVALIPLCAMPLVGFLPEKPQAPEP